MTLFQDNISPYVSFVEGAAPGSPAATNFRLFYDSADHLLKWKNSAGTVTTIATGGGGSGSITASGYTQTTARMLGRTTASTGAIEEITVGSGLSLSAGALTATGGSAGALVFLEAHTASSSATLDFTSFISSTYDKYLFQFVEIVPATNSVEFRALAGTGGGPTWDTGANYNFAGVYNGVGDSATGYSGGGQTSYRICNSTSTTANYGINGSMWFYAPQVAAYKGFVSDVQSMAVGNLYHFFDAGVYASTTTMTGVRFLFASGNIASGDIYVYGITKS